MLVPDPQTYPTNNAHGPDKQLEGLVGRACWDGRYHQQHTTVQVYRWDSINREILSIEKTHHIDQMYQIKLMDHTPTTII